LNAPAAAAAQDAGRAINRRRVWVFTALVAVTVVLGAAMLSTVLAAPAAHLAVEPPPAAGVEPRPQPPIGRGGTGDPAEPPEGSGQPQPVSNVQTGRDPSSRSPGEATGPVLTAADGTAPAGGSGTGSPNGPSTAGPAPASTTTGGGPTHPQGAGDSAGVYYKNCGQARKAGALPLFRGDPGYSARLDKDGDGEACNKRDSKK
jgi:hypothetical protein